MIISTGMATLDEVTSAVQVAKEAGCSQLSVLHCISSYPTPPDQCNLAALKTLSDHCSCRVGWSDHSVNPGVLYRAVNKWGASVIEFHLDIDELVQSTTWSLLAT